MTERRHRDGWVEIPGQANGTRVFKNINNPNEIVVKPENRGAMPGYYVMLVIPGGHLPHTEVNDWVAADDLSWFLDYLFGLEKYDKKIKFESGGRYASQSPKPRPRHRRGGKRKVSQHPPVPRYHYVPGDPAGGGGGRAA